MPANIEEGFATRAIHVGQDPEQWSHRSVIPPLVMSSTFRQDGPAQHRVSCTPVFCFIYKKR